MIPRVQGNRKAPFRSRKTACRGNKTVNQRMFHRLRAIRIPRSEGAALIWYLRMPSVLLIPSSDTQCKERRQKQSSTANNSVQTVTDARTNEVP